MKDFITEQIAPGVVRIMDIGQVYMFLVMGKERALLIDTGYGYGDLKGLVSTLTELPLDVVCTHGHIDHAGGAYAFDKVWLSEADWDFAAEEILPEKREAFLRNMTDQYDPAKLIPARESGWEPLSDGQRFELGDCTVTAVPAYGHTKGTMAMLIEPQKILLMGDACNSATFMFFECSSTIEEYRESLISMKAWSNRHDTVLFSHPHNIGGKEVLEQAIALCDEIISGKDDRVPVKGYEEHNVHAGRKMLPDFTNEDQSTANIWYDPCRIN